MRSVVALLLIFLIAGGGFAAPFIGPPKPFQVTGPRAPLGSIEELGKLRSTRPPVVVTGSGMSVSPRWNFPTGPSGSVASQTYKTGKGVVLGPGRWRCVSTGSCLSVRGVNLDYVSAPRVNDPSDNSFVVIEYPTSADKPEAKMIDALFQTMQGGLHTYMLTVYFTVWTTDPAMQAPPDLFRIQIGDQVFSGTQLVMKPGIVRALFTYTPTTSDKYDGFLAVAVNLRKTPPPDPPEANHVGLYNMQLVQLD